MLSGIITIVLTLLFVAIWIWAWQPRHRRDFEAIARLALDENTADANRNAETGA